MSGFSYPSNRWYFIYFVILVIEVAKRYNIGERINKKECVICTGVLIASVIILIANNETTFFLIIRTIVYCIFTVTAILTLYKGNATIFMTWCICFSIVNGLIFMLPTDKGGSGSSDWFISMENLLNYEFTSIAEQDVDETNYFERKDIYSDNISAGISLVTDENRTTSYFSLINKCMYEFWCELEISPAIWANWNLKGLDTRSELQALLSCSQYTQYYEDEEGIVRENINDSEWYLPLGFTYDTYITREEFEVLNTTDKAKVMLENIVLEEENILLDKGEESSDSQKLNITVETENAIWDNNKELITTDAGGKLRIYIKDIEMVNKFLAGEGELYVDLNDFYRTQGDKNTLYVGNKRLQICKIDNTQYYTGLTDYLVNVTELKRDEQGYYIDIKFSSEIQEWHLDSIECWFHSLKEISSLVDKRSNNTLSDLSIVSDRICGTINTNDKEILFMSIPYSSGWTAYVDGNEVEILKSNVGFISIIPGEGIHEIEFIYHAPGIIIGGMISGISFLLGIILLFFDYKKYRSNLKKEL